MNALSRCERKTVTTGKRCKGKAYSQFLITLPDGRAFTKWLCSVHERSLKIRASRGELSIEMLNPEKRHKPRRIVRPNG